MIDTLERLHGISVADIMALRQRIIDAGVDLSESTAKLGKECLDVHEKLGYATIELKPFVEASRVTATHLLSTVINSLSMDYTYGSASLNLNKMIDAIREEGRSHDYQGEKVTSIGKAFIVKYKDVEGVDKLRIYQNTFIQSPAKGAMQTMPHLLYNENRYIRPGQSVLWRNSFRVQLGQVKKDGIVVEQDTIFEIRPFTRLTYNRLAALNPLFRVYFKNRNIPIHVAEQWPVICLPSPLNDCEWNKQQSIDDIVCLPFIADWPFFAEAYKMNYSISWSPIFPIPTSFIRQRFLHKKLPKDLKTEQKGQACDSPAQKSVVVRGDKAKAQDGKGTLTGDYGTWFMNRLPSIHFGKMLKRDHVEP